MLDSENYLKKKKKKKEKRRKDKLGGGPNRPILLMRCVRAGPVPPFQILGCKKGKKTGGETQRAVGANLRLDRFYP